jgi:hypothetical protein
MQDMSTREQLGDFTRAFLVIERWRPSRRVGSIVEMESWHGLDGEGITGAFAKVS